MLSVMPQGRDGQASIGLGLLLFHSAEGNLQSPCKSPPPLKAIKGEPGLTTKFIEFTILARRIATSSLPTTKSRLGT